MDERSPQKTKELHLIYWNKMLGVNNCEPCLPETREMWALVGMATFEGEGEGKERTAGERGGRAWNKGGTLLFFRFFFKAQIVVVKFMIV